MTAPFKFVDLFCGIGGFHAALGAMGGECVYAVDIDPQAAAVYRRNWGMDPLGDITADASDGVMNVPPHDVLVAGFPCQPFSKSGAQRGMDETRGALFWHILEILDKRRPTLVLLENVRNLAGPRHLHEWQVIVESLRELGYRVSETPAILSPHLLHPDFGGAPQSRERVFISATYNPDGISDGLPVKPVLTNRDRVGGWDPLNWDLETDLPLDANHHVAGRELTKEEFHWIDAWNDFVELMRVARHGRRLPGFPIWADSWRDHNRPIPADTPAWKTSHLEKNYEFYRAYRHVLDPWAERWGLFSEKFPPSRRKFEWQAQDALRLWDCVMHFRPSGIRAKRPTYLPALVAITQTSIIGPRERRISAREAARLQGLPDSFAFGDQPDAATYRQLGNGVNVGVVWQVLKHHVRRDEDVLKRTKIGRNLFRIMESAPESPKQLLASHKPAEPHSRVSH